MKAMEHNKDIPILSTTLISNNDEETEEHVRHSEIPAGFALRTQSPLHRNYIERIGLYNVGVLIIGAIASFLAMAFLALLWGGSENARHGRPTPMLWFEIALRPNWATRVVTISSMLLRLATAAQMGVFSALIAAWILETSGASAEQLPLLSVIRTVNNGPQSHIWNVFHSVRTRSKKVYSIIVILAILDVLALQFTSTLLITDFDMGIIVPQALNDSIPYGLLSQYDTDPRGGSGKIQAGTGIDLMQTMPLTYPRFAELSKPNSSYLGMDYADTGETLRAFLPLELPDRRANLREYIGPATVIDTRVRCARPSISITNITFLINAATNDPYEIVILGNITMEGVVPGITINVTEEPQSGRFVSTAVARIYANTTDWRLSYNQVEVGDLFTQEVQPEPWMSELNLMSFLLINITGNDWARVLESIDYMNGIVGPYTWIQKSSGIWSDLKTTNETIDIGISATVCFASLASNDLWIRANSEQSFTEPRGMTWDRGSQRYETGKVRDLLGVTKEYVPLEKRGVLSLRQPANWTEAMMSADSEQYISASVIGSLDKLLNPSTGELFANAKPAILHLNSAILTPYSQYNSVHRAHAALFQDIMQSTGNPALAIQAMFTTISQMAYYEVLPLFFLRENATIATSNAVNVPVQWKGFGVVMALLVFHAILVVVAIVLFFSKTNHSLLGNAWQAVAQVSSSDTMDTMHHASNMTDLEIKRLLRMRSCEDSEIVLETNLDSGRCQAAYRR